MIHIPIDLLKFSYKISVFFTSEEYTSDATIGQNGTLTPNSYDTAKAIAVFPVPGSPTKSGLFFVLRDKI